MQELQAFIDTYNSAVSTAQICWKQSVKDCRKVYAIARPIILYTAAVLYVLGCKSYELGCDARAWCDRLVDESLEQPATDTETAIVDAVETVAGAVVVAAIVVDMGWAALREWLLGWYGFLRYSVAPVYAANLSMMA